ncbi:hypothetical protein HG535_0H01280 [Zygotorulaspora mrakii]|uniref:Structural maintenance of chromosomes protein n=1 Tax=Zygotorulaspora mrakii TaxID=42260 RepID=A0A7H9B7T8_ZYGMR|nr:uncharacterized protein HG535_0H01280 [Zygotorulaspora mrakii]QLG74801.1 hypothetical protein HG535_0H01280 [Zygotorulaspora mrakii]
MYIKRVVIKGFKTYRNETVIDNFSPHHNIVIGSNGSGKSNFFAAIRFVLSDDYSNLKREERQGLIHQGSGSVMSASVEIVFHDPEHRMILPSGVSPRGDDETFVRRTVGLKKDDYQLNDRNVTKGDVFRMLESAGFSMSNPYNIVPQGRIIALTNAKDKERLQLLEDVVGAKSFEIKLRASLKKMDETERKRSQISSEMEELNGKLNEMEEEKKELEKFNSLDKNRKCYQFNLYDRELNDVINEIERLDGDYNSTLHSSEQYIEELDKREDVIAQISRKLQNMESTLKIKGTTELSQATTRLNDLNNEIAALIVKISDLQRQVKANDEQAVIDGKNLEYLNEIIAKKQNQLQKISPRFEELSKDEISLKMQLVQLKEKQRDLLLKKGKYARFTTKEERNAWIENELNELNSTLTSLKNLQAQLSNDKNDINAKLEVLDEEIEDLSDSIQGGGIVAELEDLERELLALKEEYGKKIDERKELWRSEQRLQTVFETVSENVSISERSVDETMSRSLANGISSVKEITEKLKLPEGKVYGTLGELIKVSDKYKMCAEVVGGNSLFHIVVDTDETASLLLKELYRMKGGRVTVMPLNRIFNDPNVSYPPNEQSSSCTPLLKKIKYDARFEKAVKHVFGKAIVVKDLGQGARIAKRFKLNAITLDGDRADQRGVLTGGYHEQHKKTRLDSLRSLKNSRTQQINVISELERIREKIKDSDSEVDSINGSIRRLYSKKENIVATVDTLRAKLNNKKSEKIFLEESDVSLTTKLEKTLTNIKLKEEKMNDFMSDLDRNLDNELSAVQQKELNDLTETIKQVQNSINITSEALQGLTTNIDILNAELNSKLLPQQKELNSKKSDVGDLFITDLKDEVRSSVLERKQLEHERDNCSMEVTNLKNELDSLKGEKKNNEKLLDKANSQQALLLKKLETFQKNAEKSMIKKTTLASRREELQQKIREIGLLPEDALNEFDGLSSEELLKKLNSVTGKISGLKNVNKRAFENYKRFHEKRTELEERTVELEESKSSIQNLIAKLQQQKVTAVDLTFKKVSENFSNVFEKLVPKGAAKLLIHRASESDKDNDVNMDENPSQIESAYSGVSISVSFNSKKNEQLHVEQLSGGQKTVCAVALILAIQMVDPAPFYLFDEVDAALDKQYRTAVANIIKDLSRNAQFICTTFRTDMLQVADTFFRVKYENKISTVVEVDREDAINFLSGNNKFAEN